MTTLENTPPRPELLAPAGDAACASAAVENGADAVYFGLRGGLNARARAVNFAPDELPELMGHLHRRGVKGYVTLNTLVFHNELAALELAARQAIAAGVDAVLVQDLGAARLIHALCPDWPMHASTQMSLTSAEGIGVAESLGLQRVVLARELSLEEIGRIRGQTRLGLEVFVHGALCIAVSGQCMASLALGGRSANRGQCAQACRLPYQLICDGRPLDLGPRKHLLSPRDLAAYDLLPQLLAAGVDAFKIEGRLKSADYVAHVTRHYRTAIDAACAGRRAQFTPQQRAELEVSFSRGFSTGWLEGCDHKALVPGESSAKQGVCLGVLRGVSKGCAGRVGRGRPARRRRRLRGRRPGQPSPGRPRLRRVSPGPVVGRASRRRVGGTFLRPRRPRTRSTASRREGVEDRRSAVDPPAAEDLYGRAVAAARAAGFDGRGQRRRAFVHFRPRRFGRRLPDRVAASPGGGPETSAHRHRARRTTGPAGRHGLSVARPGSPHRGPAHGAAERAGAVAARPGRGIGRLVGAAAAAADRRRLAPARAARCRRTGRGLRVRQCPATARALPSPRADRAGHRRRSGQPHGRFRGLGSIRRRGRGGARAGSDDPPGDAASAEARRVGRRRGAFAPRGRRHPGPQPGRGRAVCRRGRRLRGRFLPPCRQRVDRAISRRVGRVPGDRGLRLPARATPRLWPRRRRPGGSKWWSISTCPCFIPSTASSPPCSPRAGAKTPAAGPAAATRFVCGIGWAWSIPCGRRRPAATPYFTASRRAWPTPCRRW